jgi:predicted transcriptional regulator
VQIKEVVGKNIYHYRNRLGISQETLAARAKMGSDYIAKCERGQMNMTLENIAKISKGLEISPAKLFTIRRKVDP